MIEVKTDVCLKPKKGAAVTAAKVGVLTVFGLLAWTVVLPLAAAAVLSKAVFGKRVTPMLNTVTYDDYKDRMDRQEMSFVSRGNRLAGCRYSAKGKGRGKALVLVCHGIGCNMDGYLNRTAWFVDKGYEVFTFDMTGTCRSEGDGLGGLMQSKIDLHNAINFCASRPEFEGLPILVYGHSWSGFAAANVLNYGHKELTAVATLSGFNDTWDIMKIHASRYVGKLAVLIKPWSRILELLKYGDDAKGDGVSGINAYGGPVLVAHSSDDSTVPINCSVYVHRDEIVNPNAEYILFTDRGHTLSRPVAAESRISEDYRNNRKGPLEAKGANVFQYNVDDRYRFSDKKTVFAIDDAFMEQVDDFFTRALAARAERGEEEKLC